MYLHLLRRCNGKASFLVLSRLKKLKFCRASFGSLSPDLSETARDVSALDRLEWIPNSVHGFHVDGSNVKVLQHPVEFYESLLKNIRCARNRITLASLYLGTGKEEHALVEQLLSVKKRHENLRLQVLLDYTRGMRGSPNSCSMLLPLLNHRRVDIALYHTPELRGFLKRLLPHRWNELVGLQHMKTYIFDNTVIVSGANLSRDYFTNRQDRYVVIENCTQMASYLDSLISTVMTFSLQLQKNKSFKLHPSWKIHPFEGNQDQFVEEANDRISRVLEDSTLRRSTVIKNVTDTVVFPLVQMAPIGICQDEAFVKLLLGSSPGGSRLMLASGYFNLTDVYKRLLMFSSRADVSILMASPKGNGFYGAGGVAGAIPSVYTQLASSFYQQIKENCVDHRIHLFEYEKPGWTFHAKGLWYYLPHDKLPSLTAIGSPNFGYRSSERDLELQLVVVTKNNQLRQLLHQEKESLLEKSSSVGQSTFSKPDRYVPMWVRSVSRFFKDFF